MNFFAPLVGVFGLDGAEALSDYKNLSVRPYGIQSDAERVKKGRGVYRLIWSIGRGVYGCWGRRNRVERF